MWSYLLALGGALVGGAVGYAAFFWIAGQGLYMLALPGVLVGVGAGLLPTRSVAFAVLCGVLAQRSACSPSSGLPHSGTITASASS